jgi:hypothetical protein
MTATADDKVWLLYTGGNEKGVGVAEVSGV